MQLRGEDRFRASPETTLSGRISGDGDRDLGRRPSGSVSTASDSTNATNAQREMIIPNKSTIAEEEIEVPYGRDCESPPNRSPSLSSTRHCGAKGPPVRIVNSLDLNVVDQRSLYQPSKYG